MTLQAEWAAAAAVWIVDHGLDFESARRKAAASLGVAGRRGADAPDNLAVEDAVREHIALFCPDEQAQALHALRTLALKWLERLHPFAPCVGGAVWRGIATEHSPLLIDVYSDDPTAPELHLLDAGVRFETGERADARWGTLPLLGLQLPCASLGIRVPVEITVWPTDAQRGALLPDARGQRWRGTHSALAALMNEG